MASTASVVGPMAIVVAVPVPMPPSPELVEFLLNYWLDHSFLGEHIYYWWRGTDWWREVHPHARLGVRLPNCIFVRHSMFPQHWMKRMMPRDPMGPVHPFYVVAPAVYGNGDDLNVSDYDIVMILAKDVGPVQLCWSQGGGNAMWDSMMFLRVISVGSSIHVPERFVTTLRLFYFDRGDTFHIEDWLDRLA